MCFISIRVANSDILVAKIILVLVLVSFFANNFYLVLVSVVTKILVSVLVLVVK